MTGEAVWTDNTEIICETAGSSTSMSDGTLRECDSDDLQSADVDGYPSAWAEFDTAAGGFSAAPTAGALINIYEQKINSDGNDAPDVSSSYLHDFVGNFVVAPSDTQQRLRTIIPVNKSGGKYWLEWLDGGAGTASIDAGWEFRVTPTTQGQAA